MNNQKVKKLEDVVSMLNHELIQKAEEVGQTVSDAAQAVADLENQVEQVKEHYKTKIVKM